MTRINLSLTIISTAFLIIYSITFQFLTPQFLAQISIDIEYSLGLNWGFMIGAEFHIIFQQIFLTVFPVINSFNHLQNTLISLLKCDTSIAIFQLILQVLNYDRML